MDLDLTLTGNYTVKVEIFGFTLYNKKGTLNLEHEFVTPSVSFSQALSLPGSLKAVVSLNGVNVNLTVSLAGAITLYSHTFNVEDLLTAKVGTTKSLKFPDFVWGGDTLTDVVLNITVK